MDVHVSRRLRVRWGQLTTRDLTGSLGALTGRRDHLDTMLRAVAGLVSSQERAPRPDQPHPLTESSTGRHGRVIRPALDRSTTAHR